MPEIKHHCDFCWEYFTFITDCESHEKTCDSNPAMKQCRSCAEYNIEHDYDLVSYTCNRGHYIDLDAVYQSKNGETCSDWRENDQG